MHNLIIGHCFITSQSTILHLRKFVNVIRPIFIYLLLQEIILRKGKTLFSFKSMIDKRHSNGFVDISLSIIVSVLHYLAAINGK